MRTLSYLSKTRSNVRKRLPHLVNLKTIHHYLTNKSFYENWKERSTGSLKKQKNHFEKDPHENLERGY